MEGPITKSFAQTLAQADETPVRSFLAKLCAAPALHARFLNTLSLLEHIGSRKIMMSQARRAPGQDTLRHLAEETRHAFFFKRAAETMAQAPLSYDDPQLLAGAHARLYMGRLDGRIGQATGGEAAYYYMSLLVEIRAIWFYRIYQSVLAQTGQVLNLKGLLAEETRHLSEMNSHLAALGENPQTHMPAFLAFEERCFANLLAGLEQASGAAPRRPRSAISSNPLPATPS